MKITAIASIVLLLSLAVARGANPPVVNAKRAANSSPLDFNKDIEPILADNCYACHGPDPGGRKAKLRLDRPDVAFGPLKDGAIPIVAHRPDQSELISRIESSDPDDRMPPAPREALTAAQKATLRQWVAQGAKYRDHWSFEKPVRPPLPEFPAKLRSWVKNPIDAFVLDNLRKNHLEPSPEATKRELIRRVTLDLTGLLPTPAEVTAFVDDPSPGAYEKVVDRLLASPRYGEHRARYWLDVVRYGDTHGLHNDNYRDIWPYRDWVIKSFNRNERFDKFAIEQIAGDLLPPTKVDQLIATGFIRCNLSTGEGGTILEEIRVNNTRDRVEAYSTAFLGLTAGCAVCHDHKFDPLTQKDFYQLSAYFNNLTERPSNDDRFEPPPSLRIPTTQARPRYNKILAEKAAIEKQIDDQRANADVLIKQWLASGKDEPQRVSDDKIQVRFRFDENKAGQVINSADGKSYSFTGSAPVWGEQTLLWPAMRFDASTKLELPDAGDFEKDQAFSGGGWLRVRFNPTAIGDVRSGAIMSRSDSAHGVRGWDFSYENGKLAVHLIDAWPNNGIKVETTAANASIGEWHHVFFTYDGSGKAGGVKIYLDGKPQATKAASDKPIKSIRTKVPFELGRRFDSDALKLERFQDVRLYNRELSAEEVARLPREDYVAEIVAKPMPSWNDDQRHAVVEHYIEHVDPVTKGAPAQLAAIEEQLNKTAAGGAITLIAQEAAGLPYAHLLTRGVYTARVERLRAAVPHFLPQPPASWPRDRLGLAKWTVSADNPLTARVAVNRMWQEIFGLGLVETPSDFGLMGARPTNPELLDWLAVEFRDSGWDVKHMYRLIVTSATYRQSARTTPERHERDPQNRLLSRGPRFRMDAEMLRDTALEAAGLLVEKVDGPSVKPYQPPGVWEAVRGLATNPQNWVQDKGEGTYRRSLYTFLKRQAPTPDVETFNAPSRDVSCPRRDRTNTPLQALVLWDDPQWVEASRFIAQRAIREAGESPQVRLDFISNLLLSRPLLPQERQLFLSALEKIKAKYVADPKAAMELLSVGDSKPDATIPPAELASWTLVASEIVNSDEALNK